MTTSITCFVVALYMEVSWNGGTPKSSILIGCSIINHPFWGTPHDYGNHHMHPYARISSRKSNFPQTHQATYVGPSMPLVLLDLSDFSIQLPAQWAGQIWHEFQQEMKPGFMLIWEYHVYNTSVKLWPTPPCQSSRVYVLPDGWRRSVGDAIASGL